MTSSSEVIEIDASIGFSERSIMSVWTSSSKFFRCSVFSLVPNMAINWYYVFDADRRGLSENRFALEPPLSLINDVI